MKEIIDKRKERRTQRIAIRNTRKTKHFEICLSQERKHYKSKKKKTKSSKKGNTRGSGSGNKKGSRKRIFKNNGPQIGGMLQGGRRRVPMWKEEKVDRKLVRT